MLKIIGIAGIAVSILACRGGELSEVQKKQLEKLNREKVRAYWIYAGGGNFEKAAAAGFNLACIQYKPDILPESAPPIRGEADLAPNAVAKMRQTVAEAKKHGIVPIFSSYMLNNDVRKELAKNKYRRLVNIDGRTAGAVPCSLERDYWMNYRKPIMLSVARALAENDTVGGVSLEGELYGEQFFAENDQRLQLCFCDACFTRFVREHNLQVPAGEEALDKRGKWITAQGLNSLYAQDMYRERLKLMKEVLSEVRKTAPGFLLAFYPYAPSFVNNADIKAAATPELPVLIFSPQEYFDGYTGTSAGRMRYLRASGENVRYLGGLTIGHFANPLLLTMQMRQLLQFADGYWLYWGGTLFSGNWKAFSPGGKAYRQCSAEYYLEAPQPEYWANFNFLRQSTSVEAPKRVMSETVRLEATGKTENLLTEFVPVAQFRDLAISPAKGSFILRPDGGKKNYLEAVECPVPVEIGATYCLSFDYSVPRNDMGMCQLGMGIVNEKYAWGIYEFHPLAADGKKHHYRMLQTMVSNFFGMTPEKLAALPLPWKVKFHLQPGTADQIEVGNIKLEKVERVVRTIPFSLKAGEELGTVTWTAEAPELIRVQLYDDQGRILLDQIASGVDCGILSRHAGIREFKLAVIGNLIPGVSELTVKIDIGIQQGAKNPEE